MRVIDNPKISSIKRYISFDIDHLQKTLNEQYSLYIIDNMMLSKIRKDVVKNPLFIKGLNDSKLIIIPEVILEEAARNLPNEQAFRHYYYEFFKILSQDKEVFIVNLETIFKLMQNMVGKTEALKSLKNIVLEAVRINQTITGLIKEIKVDSASVIEDINKAIIYKGKNAGERFITIYALTFIRMLYSPIYIFSEDVKGIYGAFRTFIANERLMELLDIQDHVELIEQYQFLTYETLIQLMCLETEISKENLVKLIDESERNESRHVLYSLDGYSCHTPIPNHQLAEWIIERRIRIQF